jgi:acyl-CoA dehydrogenase
MEVIREVQAKAIAAGLYAANMPEEVGGAGLDTLSWLLYERELGPRQLCAALDLRRAPLEHPAGGHPGDQRERYLMPCIRGETWDCLAMTEPGAGSDLRGMKAHRRGRTAGIGC